MGNSNRVVQVYEKDEKETICDSDLGLVTTDSANITDPNEKYFEKELIRDQENIVIEDEKEYRKDIYFDGNDENISHVSLANSNQYFNDTSVLYIDENSTEGAEFTSNSQTNVHSADGAMELSYEINCSQNATDDT